MTAVEKFLQIFRSRENACAFGRISTERSQKGKVKATYHTSRRPYTADDVEKHLAGDVSIVAIPLLQDGTCTWGSGDPDNYADFDLAALNEARDKLALPLYIFPSKSGAAHLFVFFPGPRPAEKVRLLIQTWMAKLNVLYAPDGSLHEIFPKQTYTTECGNGINLPFFGDAAGFEKFSPVTYDVPVEQWLLDPPAQSRREASAPSSDAKLKGVKLRLGWDPETQLKEAGLVYGTRNSGDTTYFDYYEGMGLCLLAGAKHDGGAMAEGLNPRMSTFVYHKDTRRFYHQCFADGCRQKSNKTATALSRLNVDVNLIVEDEDNLAMEEAAIPEYPAECLEGDAIAEFTHAVTDGTGVPPQFVRAALTSAVQLSCDSRVGYPGHEHIKLHPYHINVSNLPRTGKGEAYQRAFGDQGLAKALLSGINNLEGTNCASGQFAAKKVADIRAAEDKRLLEVEGGKGSDAICEIRSEEDVLHILAVFNLQSERDIAVKLGHTPKEIDSAFKRDLRKAIKLRDADILKRGDQAPVREPQPDDDYLRVWLVHDELLNAYKNGDTSLEELLLATYERSFLAHGSFTNGERRVDNLSLAFSGDTTRKGFDEIYTGKPSANSGFLARCTLCFAKKRRLANWRPMDADKAIRAARLLAQRIAKLPKSRIGGNDPWVPSETNAAKELREEFLKWLDQQPGQLTAELDSHFRRDVLVRVVASGSVCIDEAHVKPAIAWTKYQLALRAALYPADNEDVVGQIASKVLALLDKDPSKPWTDALFDRFLHFNTRNHGTSEHYVRARLSLLRSITIAQFGINRKGHPMYQRSGNFVQISAEDKQRFEEYKAREKTPNRQNTASVSIPPQSTYASGTQTRAEERASA